MQMREQGKEELNVFDSDLATARKLHEIGGTFDAESHDV